MSKRAKVSSNANKKCVFNPLKLLFIHRLFGECIKSDYARKSCAVVSDENTKVIQLRLISVSQVMWVVCMYFAIHNSVFWFRAASFFMENVSRDNTSKHATLKFTTYFDSLGIIFLYEREVVLVSPLSKSLAPCPLDKNSVPTRFPQFRVLRPKQFFQSATCHSTGKGGDGLFQYDYSDIQESLKDSGLVYECGKKSSSSIVFTALNV